MEPPVLRNRNRDHSLVWMGACFVAVFATVLICTWLICVFLQLMPALFLEGVTLVDARGVKPWLYAIVLFFVAYVISQTGQYSEFAALRRMNTHGIMRYVGAERVPFDSGDPHFRRLLNVNEEIAIAAGRTPVSLYWLPNEMAINAFTAGVDRSEASLCVTEGALRYLTRDELQSVLAHEYGHVANGDVGTNTMLARWLGVLMPMGFHSRKSHYLDGLLFIAAFAAITGFLGIFIRDFWALSAFCIALLVLAVLAWLPIIVVRLAWRFGANLARLSHAAHSRERELEADALAARFTRNPGSLADALRKIGGLKRGTILTNGKAALFSHMCIAPALYSRRDDAYATHPKIDERLAQLGFPLTVNERLKLGSRGYEVLGEYAADVDRELGIMHAVPTELPRSPSTASPPSADRKIAIGAVHAPPDVHQASRLLGMIPPELRQGFRDATGARAATRVLLGLPLTKDAAFDSRMLDYRKLLEMIGPHFRLPMLELATPALRQLPDAERASLLAELRAGIEADAHISLHEFVFFALISHAVGTKPTRDSKMTLPEAYTAVLNIAARAFGGNTEKIRRAFDAGARASGLSLDLPEDQAARISLLEPALARLRALDDLERPRVIEAVTAVVQCDGTLDLREFEFVRAIGSAIDCPVPLSSPQ
ncbi:MAG TPA: M48 family metalloprotease [Steroidobacteraceae bacterium]